MIKIGNIKIGEKRKGKPIVREGFLVTQAVKDNEEEHFVPFPGFTRAGVEELEIVLPFDDINLNFETTYVSFGDVRFFTEKFIKAKKENKSANIVENEKYEKIVPYIFKEIKADEEKIIIGIPLSEYEPDIKAPYLYFGKSSEELLQKLKMEYTGFLRVMLNGISGWGEVFHFKTKSKMTIKAIKNQLETINKMTKSLNAGIMLKMKIFRKQFKEKTFPFVDISIPASNIKELNSFIAEHLESRKNLPFDIKELELKEKKLPLFNFYQGYEKTFDIVFEENKEIIHEIDDDINEIEDNEFVEEILKKTIDKFKLKNTHKALLKTLVKKMCTTIEKDIIEETLNEKIEKIQKEKENISLKDITELIKEFS